MNISPRFLLFIGAIAMCSILRAEETKRPGLEAAQLLEKAAQAKSEGRYDEAKDLYDKAQKLRSEAHERDVKKGGTDVPKNERDVKKGGSDASKNEREVKKGGTDAPKDERFANAKREIQELEKAGKHEEAEHRMRELREAWQREHGKDGASAEGKGPEQLRHVVEAIHHLRAAGLDELAEHLEQQARRMHEEFEQRTREHGEKPEGDKFSLLAGEVQKLREQVSKLAREMDKLHEEAAHARGDGRKSE